MKTIDLVMATTHMARHAEETLGKAAALSRVLGVSWFLWNTPRRRSRSPTVRLWERFMREAP